MPEAFVHFLAKKATSVVLCMKPKLFLVMCQLENGVKNLRVSLSGHFSTCFATDDLVLVFRKDSRIKFNTAGFLSQLEEYPIARTIKAQPYVQYEQEKSGLHQMALEKVGYISYDDACDGYDQGSLYDNEAI